MRQSRTITISLPAELSKEVERVAKAEHRTVSELFREAFRQYEARRILREVTSEGKTPIPS